jgi:hypothetical protein
MSSLRILGFAAFAIFSALTIILLKVAWAQPRGVMSRAGHPLQ